MESRLTLYDIVARLVPGGFLLLCLAWLADVAGITDYVPEIMSGSTQGLAFVLVSYVLGLVLHQISYFLIERPSFRIKGKPSADFFSGPSEGLSMSRRALRDTLASGLLESEIPFDGERDLRMDSSHHLFRLALAKVEDSSSKVQSLQAQYGLHRSLASACLILFLIALIGAATSLVTWNYVALFGLFAAVFIVSGYKWGCLLVRAVFEIAASMLRSSA